MVALDNPILAVEIVSKRKDIWEAMVCMEVLGENPKYIVQNYSKDHISRYFFEMNIASTLFLFFGLCLDKMFFYCNLLQKHPFLSMTYSCQLFFDQKQSVHEVEGTQNFFVVTFLSTRFTLSQFAAMFFATIGYLLHHEFYIIYYAWWFKEQQHL